MQPQYYHYPYNYQALFRSRWCRFLLSIQVKQLVFDFDEVVLDEEEEISEYRDMDVKTLMGIVSEDSDITTVLEVLEGYMTKQDLKEVLVEIAEKM